MKIFAFVLASVLVASSNGQSEICPIGEDYWPHPDCTLYYLCNKGNPFIMNCPDTLFWNQNELYCDHPGNVPECQGGTRQPSITTTAQTTTRPTSTVPTTTRPTSTVPTSTVPTTTRPTTTVPTTTRPTTTVPTTTRPTSTVPTSTVPTTTAATTTRVTSTATSGSTTRLPPGQCPSEGIHQISHEERCEAYYLCIEGVRQDVIYVCPEGLFFDPTKGNCNLASEVDCVPPTTTTTPSTTTTTAKPGIPDCPTLEMETLPYPGNCTLYVRCIDGLGTLYRCPNGYLFDTQKLQCLPEENAVCSVFYFLPTAQKYVHQDINPIQQEISEEQIWISTNNLIQTRKHLRKFNI